MSPQNDFLNEKILVVKLHAKDRELKFFLDLRILPLCQRECLWFIMLHQ